jgi:hypothetical protein
MTFSLRNRVHTGSVAHPASYSMCGGGSFSRGSSGRGVKLTTHIHLMARLRIRGVEVFTSSIHLHDVVNVKVR